MKYNVKATRRSEEARSLICKATAAIQEKGLEEAAQEGVQKAVEAICSKNQRTAQALDWVKRQTQNKREAQELLKAIARSKR